MVIETSERNYTPHTTSPWDMMRHCCPYQRQWPGNISIRWAAQLPIRARMCTRATAGSGSWDDGLPPFDARTKQALREAAQILAEAQQLAQQQTLQELSTSWHADSLADTPPAAGMTPSSDAAVEAFLVEQGLAPSAASCLLSALKADLRLSSSCRSTTALTHKFDSLRRVLPDTDVPGMVEREPELLLASSSQLVNTLVEMVQALPGRDVISMVAQRPKLLLVGDMADRLRRIMRKLLTLHPSHDEAVIAGILEDNPELLLRMDYYLSDDVRLIDELPIEIQNMMVLGDESGVGFLYRYWRDKHTAEQQQQQQLDWDGSTA